MLQGLIFSCDFQQYSDDQTLQVTLPNTYDDETSPTIQDGTRQTGSSPHCI